jgi:hypothetical protein
MPDELSVWDMSIGTVGPSEADRIWRITRQTAEGCNAPVVADAAEPTPVVDMAGWDVA